MPVNLLDKPMYRAWVAMRRNTSPKAAPHIRRLYDGISVCPEWREDYDAFQEWSFANGWEKGLRLTRKDKKGDFCPENCFWTTLEEANGWRSVVHHLSDGRTIRDVIGRETRGEDRARHNNISRRVFCEGWELEEAVDTPIRDISPQGQSLKTGEEAPLYNAWRCMRRTCKDGLSFFGGWDRYRDFREWSIANGWKPGAVLHRRDTKGNFTPENCYWKEGR